MIKVSIIIPVFNEEKYIEDCLDSIIKNDFDNSHMEILIVDGGSTDKTVLLIEKYQRKYPIVQLLHNPKKIVPISMNIGITAAKGKYICRLDAHATYPSSYISKLLYWSQKLSADNVGGIIDTLPVNDKLESIAISEAMSSSFGVGNSKFRTLDSGDALEVDTVPFGFYDKNIFTKIGLYDEDLIRNQDDELNARLIKNGGKIFLIPEIKIEYFARDSFKKMSRMFYQYGYFKPLVNKKIKSVATLRQFVPLLFVLFLLLGFLLSLIFHSFQVIYLAGIFSYLIANMFVSYKLAKSIANIKLFPYLVKSFFLIHISYGLGYLEGIFNFIILNKNSVNNNNEKLSR